MRLAVVDADDDCPSIEDIVFSFVFVVSLPANSQSKREKKVKRETKEQRERGVGARVCVKEKERVCVWCTRGERVLLFYEPIVCSVVKRLLQILVGF